MKYVIIFIIGLGVCWLIAKIVGGIFKLVTWPIKKALEKFAKLPEVNPDDDDWDDDDDFDDYALYAAIDDD